MSDAKFASITSALLARKGEAAPSIVALRSVPVEGDDLPHTSMRIATKPRRVALAPERPKHDTMGTSLADRRRRLVVTMSALDYQRLGIAAAKKNTTRHDLVWQACFDQLAEYARAEAAECRCLTSDEPCVCEEPADASPVSTTLAFTDS